MRSRGSSRIRAATFRATALFVSASVLTDRAVMRLRVLPMFGRVVRRLSPMEILFTDVEQVWVHGRSATIARTPQSGLPPLTVSRWLGEAIAAGSGCALTRASGRRCRQFVVNWRPAR